MKRWIQETDGYRASLKSLIESLEVRLLIWKNLVKSNFSLFLCIRTDHLTESSDSLRIEEHMLCTAESDTFCTELTSLLSISRGISVCTNLKSSELISPGHNTSELTSDRSVYGWNQSSVNVTSCTIDRDLRSLCECLSSECELLVLLVHVDVATSRYTAGTHTTGNYGCVACHTTTYGKDTLSSLHTCDIFWRCLKTYKNDLLSSFSPAFSIVSCKYDLTTSSSWRCSKTLSKWSCSFKCSSIELWM